MGVYKEIAKADGSGITTFYRLSEENSTVETTSTGTTETMFDYNDTLNKPSINDIALVGNKTLDELGIQPAGDYITEIPAEYITEEELEAKDYATETFVMEQINNTEHFHREIVDALPLTGKDNVLYLVPKKGSDKDIYNEYIWTGTDYEFMGTTAVDLTDYYKKSEVNELLDTKVNKVDGKQLSTNDYTNAEKTKLALLENYDDSELRSKVDSLHNYDDTAIKLDIQDLKKDVSTNEIDIASIENELGYKAEVIRLVKNGDWWLCQDAKGNNLTLEMAMNRLGLPKTILLLENLENDGKYYPVEYELQEKYVDIIYKDLDGITHHLNYGYNEYFTNTASGDYIHLEDSINYPYKELSVDGVCEQETTTGKNALPKTTQTTQTINGITYTMIEDGTIALSGTATSNSYIYLITNFPLDGRYTISSGIGINSNIYLKVLNAETSYSAPLRTDISGYSTNDVSSNNLQVILYVTEGTNANGVVIKPMIRLASITDDTYEPYTGGQPSPNPDYPQEIKTIENSLKITSCNKNLFPVFEGTKTYYGRTYKFEDGVLTVNGVSTDESTFCLKDGSRTARYASQTKLTLENSILLKAGTYTIHRKKVKNDAPILIKHGQLGTNGTDYNLGSNYENLIFTLIQDEYVALMYYDYTPTEKQIIMQDFQIEKNNSFTSYEQRLETQITSNLPEGEFIGKIDDTYKDTLKVEYNEEDGQYHLVLNKMIGKVVLDGSENWFLSGSETYQVFGLNYNGIKGGSTLCSDYFLDKISVNNIKNYIGIANNGAENRLYISNGSTTLDEFKNWLSTHNTELYYALATPYVVDLGVVDMPITYNEITNLFTDSDLLPIISIEYYTEILENAKDNIIGQDIYLQDEVDTLNDLPTEANKGDIRKVKDTESWYIYDGIKWSPFDKASGVDLSNYLAKDNTIAYKPATDYNPSTKKYVDDSIADIFIPTKTSQLTNDSGFVLKSVNDLTNYYNKSNTYNKAEVNALVSSSGGGTSIQVNNTKTESTTDVYSCDYINDNLPFIAIYGETSYADIVAAHEAGKTVMALRDEYQYILYSVGSSRCVFGTIYELTSKFLVVTSDNAWSYDTETLQKNLVFNTAYNKNNNKVATMADVLTKDEVNDIIDSYGTKVNLQVGDKLGEKALSYEFPNDIENSINTSTETLCSTTCDDGGIIMISTYSNKLQYRYIDGGGGLSTQQLCTISNGATGDLTNIPKFDIEEVNTNHYLYPYLFFKNSPILNRIENLEEKTTHDTAQLTIKLAINGPSVSWTSGTDNFTINYTNGDGKFVSEKWFPTDITGDGEDKIVNIAKGTVFSITATQDIYGLKRYGYCTNIQLLAASTTSSEVTCFIYKNGSIEFADGEPI